MFSSVKFSRSVKSDSLWPHELQRARLPCPSLSPGVCSNSCPLSQWCYPAILSSAPAPFACNLSQHQSLLQWVRSLHQVVKILELQLQHPSFPWTFRVNIYEFHITEKNLFMYLLLDEQQVMGCGLPGATGMQLLSRSCHFVNIFAWIKYI